MPLPIFEGTVTIGTGLAKASPVVVLVVMLLGLAFFSSEYRRIAIYERERGDLL